MEIRIVMAACIVVGSALVGRSMAGAANRRAAGLKSLSDGLRQLRVRMISMFEPVRQSLSQSDCPLMQRVGEGMAEGRSAAAAWDAIKPALRRAGGPADWLTAADEKALDELFSQMGQHGREAQDVLLTGAAQTLDALYQAARARAAEADRLYVTLGLLTGLMLALVVI